MCQETAASLSVHMSSLSFGYLWNNSSVHTRLCLYSFSVFSRLCFRRDVFASGCVEIMNQYNLW